MTPLREQFHVSSAVAPMCAEPKAGSEQISQAVYGHAVTILGERAPWLRVRTADDYHGWMHRGFLRSDLSPRRNTRVALGCVVREDSGRRLSVPLGALLTEEQTVESGEALSLAELATRFPRAAQAIVASACERYEGTRYEWGGVTPWGADCSGMVQTMFGLHGCPLPRDSSQQAERGVDAGRDPLVLRAADLLFFSDRDDARITHVAIALGVGRAVHLALGRGGYAIEDLNDVSDAYVVALVKRFRFARRLLGE
ncbi:MAG: C40 family peptidase [Gemmatimonadota bacterium]|nr:C40 family peptidase [Gemmatimonadota bacterium]